MSIMDQICVDKLYPHVFEDKHTYHHLMKMRSILFKAVAHLDYAEKNPDFVFQDFSKYMEFIRFLYPHGFSALPVLIRDKACPDARVIFKYEDYNRAWEYYRYVTEGRRCLPSETRNSLDEIINFPTLDKFVSAVGDAPVDKRGKITKRIRNFLYKEYRIELPDIFWEYFGQKVKGYGVIPPTKVWWRITQDFDWSPGDFGDDKSCVMTPGGAYAHTLWSMRATDKFYAIQVFLSENPEYTSAGGRKKYASGLARAFLLQAADDLLVVFNAYIKPQWRTVENGANNRINSILTPLLGPGIALSDFTINGSHTKDIYVNIDIHYAYGRRIPQRLNVEVPELDYVPAQQNEKRKS